MGTQDARSGTDSQDRSVNWEGRMEARQYNPDKVRHLGAGSTRSPPRLHSSTLALGRAVVSVVLTFIRLQGGIFKGGSGVRVPA
jgi:hypothetical protein